MNKAEAISPMVEAYRLWASGRMSANKFGEIADLAIIAYDRENHERAPFYTPNITYQRRIGGAITEHQTLEQALTQEYSKISFTVDDKSARLMLWDDGTWTLRTVEGEWTDGKFRTWKQIANEYDRS